ncbi:MAG: ZIP family metal transporter [Candidatus Pacebacteria bacterium]|nr:ZIP family metal transporter [Candidatus Paceibacterota bacterium]
MNVLIIALAASAATFIGGSFALRFRDKLHLILGFSAGAVAGLALFDLLPEAISLGMIYHTSATIAFFIAVGFFGYLVLDRLILLHTHEEDSEVPVLSKVEGNAPRGFFGALTLSTHSFLDGMAIGIGFQASPAVGLIVTAAVLTHDFSDGINTVNLVLKNGGSWRTAFRWLLADAAAPLLGAASTLFFTIPESAIGLVLAVFVGTFLYLSASDLIPDSHHRHPRALTTVMTLLGAAVLYAVVHLV